MRHLSLIAILATLLLSCANPLYKYTHRIVQDMNGDGVDDVVYLDKKWNFEEGDQYCIVIRTSTKEGTLTEPRCLTNIVDQKGGPTDLKLEDVNGDHLPDLTFWMGLEPPSQYWMMNNGNDSFLEWRPLAPKH